MSIVGWSALGQALKPKAKESLRHLIGPGAKTLFPMRADDPVDGPTQADGDATRTSLWNLRARQKTNVFAGG